MRIGPSGVSTAFRVELHAFDRSVVPNTHDFAFRGSRRDVELRRNAGRAAAISE